MLRRRYLALVVFFAMLSTLFPFAREAAAVSTGVVISQVYGGGGNSGATLKNDFIELFNRGSAAIDVSAWSVQYASMLGTSWQRTNLSGSIAPGQYYLVQEAAGAGGTTNLPTPDATGTIAMSATAAKVALLSSQTTIAGGTSCPTSGVVDLVGYGGANCFEGSGAAPTLSNTTAALRAGNGCVDTDNNPADFTATAPSPRNSASPLGNCSDLAPAVSSTTPAGGASGVAVDANISITVSEPVNVTDTWFQIACATSGDHGAAVSGSPVTFVLDPATDFASAEMCTVTVLASKVNDQDLIDPPDNMAADYAFSFTTVAPSRRIHDIQGAGHVSPFAGQLVGSVPGVVTALRTNGFYMQDPNSDADEATSEGIFVFTLSAPTTAVGDALVVSARVQEFRPGGASTANLTTTELVSPTITIASHGNALPAPVIIGTGGRIPPTQNIEDDASNGNVETSGVFDPASDGLDFWESIEGMRVQLNNAVAVGPTNAFGETPIVGDDGANASLRTPRGGLLLRPDDGNPERVVADDAIVTMPSMNVGDHYGGPIVGVIDYNFGNFFIEVTQPVTRVDGNLPLEATRIPGTHELTVATFNVENLDTTDPQSKFDRLAGLIVNNLRAPDLIAVEEIQDNNGPTDDGTVDASATIGRLESAIQAAGGPAYTSREIDPVNDQDGGEPGGNIRQIFLFRTDRGLEFVDRPGGGSTTATTVVSGGSGPELSFSPGRVAPTNAAWNSSRKPLAGEFRYNTHRLFVVANHFISKGGDQPLMGHFQPPTRSSESQRHQQAQVEHDFIAQILAIDPYADVIVLGDLNDFEFSDTVKTLEGDILSDLYDDLPQPERYSYVFEGNSQTLDHILVSDSLTSSVEFDVVHVNAEFADQASDHDPSVTFVMLTDNVAPTISGAATTSPNANGWYRSPVTVHFTCADNSGNVNCPADVTIATEGAAQTASGTAVDPAGNTAMVVVGGISIDLTPPAITFTGDLSYSVDQTVSITCVASEALSGIDPSVPGGCPSAFGPALAFGLGPHTLSASATDRAGNKAERTVTFTVGVTEASLCSLTRAYATKDAIAGALCAKLTEAAAARARGETTTEHNILKAFANAVNAQTGKALAPENAAILIALGASL